MNALQWLMGHDFGIAPERVETDSYGALPPGWRIQGMSFHSMRVDHDCGASVWCDAQSYDGWRYCRERPPTQWHSADTRAEAMARATARYLGMLASQQLRQAAVDRLDLLGVVGGPEHVLVVKDRRGPGSFHDPFVVTAEAWDQLRGTYPLGACHLVAVNQ